MPAWGALGAPRGTLLAWMFLTLGIAMGSVLGLLYAGVGGGLGGFWESGRKTLQFMPWLACTALLHSAVRPWRSVTPLKDLDHTACHPGLFHFSLVGTFLVRPRALPYFGTYICVATPGTRRLLFLVSLVSVHRWQPWRLFAFAGAASQNRVACSAPGFRARVRWLFNNLLVVCRLAVRCFFRNAYYYSALRSKGR